MKRAVEILLENSSRLLKYTPEVGINIVEAIDSKYTTSVEDIAGVKGRIVKVGNKLVAVGPVEFGASSHLARLVLEAMKIDPSVRGAVNIKYSEELVVRAKSRGYLVVFVDRRLEPEEIKAIEGATLPWILREAVKQAGRVPDLIYDIGDVGKEPMIRVLGRSAIEAVSKLLDIVP